MGENEPSAASAAQPGKHMQPVECCAVGSSGASLVCVWELVLLSAVAACPHGGTCPCVRFGERRKSTSLISAITKKTLLLEFRRARKGLIRSCKHLALYCQ